MGGLQTIFPTRDAHDPKTDLDIVFIHGLNPLNSKDHALSTWTHPNGTCWPKELLPASVPSARILLFTYNSNVAFNTTSATLRGHATSLLESLFFSRHNEKERHRPIIFVSHSLGGLLVKQALVLAKTQSDRYDDLRKSTTGLMFFSTPHAGGNKAAVGNIFANILSKFTGQPKNDLLSVLKGESLYHEIINDDFNPQLSDYEVISYYETRNTKIKIRGWTILPQASIIVVDRDSAKLGSPGEILVGLDATHSEICRFSGERDDLYQHKVKEHIQELASKARSRRPKDERASLNNQEYQAERIHYMVPYSQNSRFVGQESVFNFLRDVFSHKTPTRTAVLSGIGGIGKTQCAVQYCLLRQHQDGGNIFWINAESVTALTSSFSNIYEGLPLQGEWSPGKFIRTWLSTRQNWLLVFDNVNNSTLSQVLELISQTDAGDVLVTTRDSHVIGSQGFPYGTELSVLSGVNSMLLFVLNSFSWTLSQLEEIRRVFNGPATISSYNDNLPSNIAILKDRYQIDKFSQLHHLASLVGFLPLAIVQCASYLRQYPTDYIRFVLLFDSRLLETRREFYSHSERGATYNASIMTVWENTIQELEHSLPSAAKMLTFLGFLDRNWNSEDFLTQCLFDMQIWDGSITLSLDKKHRSSLLFLDSQRLDFDRSLGQLITLSMITKSREKRRVILHPMVQEWIHLRMPKALCRQWLERAIIVLYHCVPPLLYSPADKSCPDQADLAFCHLGRVAEMLELYIDGAKKLAAECAVFFLEAYLWYRGDRYLDIAERLLASSMSSARKWVARMIYIARLYQIIQKYQESETLAIDKASYDNYSKLLLTLAPSNMPPPGTKFGITQAVVIHRLCETLDHDVARIVSQIAESTRIVSESTRVLLGSVPDFIPAAQSSHENCSAISLVCSALLAQCRAKDHIFRKEVRRASQLLEQFKEGAAVARRYNLAELAQYFNILIRTKAASQPNAHEVETLLQYVDNMCGAKPLVQEWSSIMSAFSDSEYARETNSFIFKLAGRLDFVESLPNKGAFKDEIEEEDWIKLRLATCREQLGPTSETYLNCAKRLSALFETTGRSNSQEAKDFYADILQMLESSGKLKGYVGECWAQKMWKIIADDNAYDCVRIISLCKAMLSAYMVDCKNSASSILRWSKRLGKALEDDGKDDEFFDSLCGDMLALWMNTDKEDEIYWRHKPLLTYIDEWGLVAAGNIERRGDADAHEALEQHYSKILSFFQKKRPYRDANKAERDAACFSHRWAVRKADLLEETDGHRWVEFCAATSAHFEAELDLEDEICVIWTFKNYQIRHGKTLIPEISAECNEELDHALCMPKGDIWDWTYHNIQICAQHAEESLSMVTAYQRLGLDKALEHFFLDGVIQETSDLLPSSQYRRIQLPFGAVVRDRRDVMNAWHLGHHGGLWIARNPRSVRTEEPPVVQEAQLLLLWVRPSIVGVTYINISPAQTLYKYDEGVEITHKRLSTLRILQCADNTSAVFLKLRSEEEADSFSKAFAAAGGHTASRKI